MPLSTGKPKSPVKDGIHNILAMVKNWKPNFEKGAKGEKTVIAYLMKQGFQVNPIQSWNYEKSETTFGNDHQENTIFSPDLLVSSKNEIFFGEVNFKSYISSLGIINQSKYNKNFQVMQNVKGLGFKSYFTIESPKSIYVMEKLESPTDFPQEFIQGRYVYIIPKEYLAKLDVHPDFIESLWNL